MLSIQKKQKIEAGIERLEEKRLAHHLRGEMMEARQCRNLANALKIKQAIHRGS